MEREEREKRKGWTKWGEKTRLRLMAEPQSFFNELRTCSRCSLRERKSY